MRSSTGVVVRSEVKYLSYRSLEYTIHDYISNLKTITCLYLYEVLGPAREDMSGQWSVWCSHLLKNYAVGL